MNAIFEKSNGDVYECHFDPNQNTAWASGPIVSSSRTGFASTGGSRLSVPAMISVRLREDHPSRQARVAARHVQSSSKS